MHVERITTCHELTALESEWNALAGDIPLRSWDWLATWWKHYGRVVRREGDHAAEPLSDRQLYVLAVYGDPDATTPGRPRRLIGIAPWYLDRTRIKGDILRWLGSGEVCTDHLSLICHPQDADRVAEAIADALTTQFDDWDRMDLNSVDSDDVPIRKLLTALEERDCLISRHEADSCWVLELPATWEEYLAGVSKPHRRKLRQLDRDMLDSGRVKWHRVQSTTEFEQAWPILVDLHQRRRQSLGEPGCFASQPFHDFHRELAGLMLNRGLLRLSWLELDGTPAAAEYQIAGGATTYAYQRGVDPDRLVEEPGSLSTILFVCAAIDEGPRRIDFLRGDEHYKSRWRATPHAAFDCRIVPNRRLARLRGHVLTFTDTMTDWMRNVSNSFHVGGSV